jgi:hypothetical protein
MCINLLGILTLTGTFASITILAFLLAKPAVTPLIFQVVKPTTMSAKSASDEFEVVERPSPKPAGT